VGKIAEKAVCKSVFLCILSAELTKTHSFRLFSGDFSHWVETNQFFLNLKKSLNPKRKKK